MPTLQELLDDASITDELEVNFGDKGKFKVGDLRTTRKKLTEDQKTLAATLQQAIEARQNAENLAKQAEELLTKAKTAPATGPKEGEIDFETDPLYAPLVQKLFKPLQAKVTEYESALKLLQTNLVDMGKFGMMDYYDRQWNSIPAEKRQGKTWKDYVKLAQERKVFNDYGVPDPVKTLMQELEPLERDGLTKERDTLKAKVDELTKQLESAPRMPRPGSAGVPPVKKADDKVFDSAESLIDAAFNDPTIQSVIGGA